MDMKWHNIWLLLALALFSQCIFNDASAHRDLKIQPRDRQQSAPPRAYQGMYFDSYDMYVMPVELRQDRIRQQQKAFTAKWELLRKNIYDRKVSPKVREDLHWVALGVARATGKPDSVALTMLDLAVYQDNQNKDLSYNMQGLVLASLVFVAAFLMLLSPFVFCTNHYFEIKSAYDRVLVISMVAALSLPIGLGFLFLIRAAAENLTTHQPNREDLPLKLFAIVTLAMAAMLMVFLRHMPLTRRIRPSFHLHRSMLVWLAKIPLLIWIIFLLAPASPMVHSFLGFSEPLKRSEQQADIAYRGAVKASEHAFDRFLVPIALTDYSKFMARLGNKVRAQTLEKLADVSYQKLIQDRNYLAQAKSQLQRKPQFKSTSPAVKSQFSARKWSFDGFGQRVLNLVGVITGSLALVVVIAPELVVALFGYLKHNSLRDASFKATCVYRKLLYGATNPVLGDFLLVIGRLTQPFDIAQSQVYFQQGLNWYRQRLGVHERTAEALQLLGRTRLKGDDFQTALALFEEALQMSDGTWTADRTCSLFIDISRAHLGLGKYLPARDFNSRAIEVARQHVAAEDERIRESFGLIGSQLLAKSLLITCLHEMAKTHIAFGRYADAQLFCQEAVALHQSFYRLSGQLDAMKTLLTVYEKRNDLVNVDRLRKQIEKIEKLQPKRSPPVEQMQGCLHPFGSRPVFTNRV
jgi:tetratricopeptide (TPR) repeat protein